MTMMTMNKAQLVDEIVSINVSAPVAFLMSFEEVDLRRYLEHLELTREPRGRRSVWVRGGETPAVLAAAA